MEATSSAKTMVSLYQSTRNHISEQRYKNQDCKGQYKIQIVLNMNGARSCWRMMAEVAVINVAWFKMAQVMKKAKTEEQTCENKARVAYIVTWRQEMD